MIQDEIMKLQTYKMFEGEDTVYVERDDVLEVLKQEPCKDCISRESIKQKLQEHHDFFVNAYGGFSNLPQNNKSRVDEITNCIAMVVNEPPITPKGVTITDFADKCRECGREKVLDKIRAEIDKLPDLNPDYEMDRTIHVSKWAVFDIIDKYKEVDREYKESKWVKVEDELPELYREVWLSCRDYEVWLSCRGYKKAVRGYLSPNYHKSWYVYDSECGYYSINNANAWMYVERPKPYKAESEDKEWQIGW